MMFTRFIKRQTTDSLHIDWRNFYRQVLILVIPMALQNLINVGVSSADVVMLGKVGETVLSGSSLAGQIQFIMTLFFFGLTSGATVLTAQYWGKGDTRTIEKVLGMGLTAGLIIAAIFTVAAMLIPAKLMQIFTNDPEVIAEGVKYLRIVGWAYMPMAVTQVYLNIVRSIERVVIATVVYSMSLLINVFLNWTLIFGNLGAPALGIEGAAIATLIARLSEVLLVMLYAIYKNKVVRIRLRDMLWFDPTLIKDFVEFSLPVIANELMWGLGTAAYAAIIGRLGSSAVAANSVAQVARQLAMVVVFGISNATAIYLGKTIGEKKVELAKAYARRFIWLSLIFGVLGALIILASTPLVTANLVLSAQAKYYLQIMFRVMAVYGIAQALNTTIIVGIFRSGGDTRVGLLMDVCSMWCGSIVMGLLAAFVFKAPVVVVYLFLMSDELIKVPFSLKRFRSYKWLNNVTREIKE